MSIKPFNFAATPHIHFGAGQRARLKELAGTFAQGGNNRLLLLTGGQSFDDSAMCQALWDDLSAGFDVQRLRVAGEPSPALIDAAVTEYHAFNPCCVIAIGGGSTVDAAKAIAGLLPLGESVMEYLEGVGKGRTYCGPATPFIAVPTTAGTGGETSKNAVLSVIGEHGYKKSFRDEMLVARHIILDPELTLSCPPELTAACGMDAFTQLLESYVSSRANPMTDALALSGMQMVRDHLLTAVEQGERIEARSAMLYASSLSGLTLANAGLGSVHGLASPLGAFFPIPHGVVCGTLLHAATQLNISAMQSREPGNPALGKYAEAGRLLVDDAMMPDDVALDALLAVLEGWCEGLKMKRLGEYGVAQDDIPRIVANSRGNSMQTNPIVLSDEEIAGLISCRL
ncbi:MAG: alcohol dehydrogenase [Zetaproteobacteria bacterium CG12_big_fil_rev_8_21_14_0_65_55_1124]|nr:MAG: alcohol dehydrogenase [Zetaproteobacteria bacterium CG1_02_55_237]PIS19379.1 MAG: alcohol dehydrogenase [Zetaproteobacteria bacterium CG08_land_8_20_14_0_20_55_17]PIW43423.1 MAG: alcohol dehydrogenase [Zetaproteobacteria bacterium CG12_big_fil_rev_8_21_14_0_65_55_1124]PIY53620.1 MAG: alcohol dehydrogenase [Zetaproteobacteria bacterium CG_4_10_14_0_8_um_filter_55_43]PIZ37279.1 MAG: alcohol dehydrogenase [Zetaproteobacteria bacterium CG_4_10_14_0_2_um_filter_55_20]PJB81933.1 MAG: alcohol